MSQSIVEMAKDLVVKQIQSHRIESAEVLPLLHSTHMTLMSLHQMEGPTAAAASPEKRAEPGGWRRSITKHSVTCLECGATFKQLSARHLSTHDLNPRSYRVKYGIPRAQALSARDVTVRRRQLAKQIRPWEQTEHQKAKKPAPAKAKRAAKQK